MKIEGNYKNNLNVKFQDSQSLSASKNTVSRTTEGNEAESNVTLSSAAKSILQGEKEQVDTKKVAALKSAVKSGNYDLSAEKIADGMLKEFD